MKPVKSGIWAYIAPVNHNSINIRLVASITSTMLDNYCQDTNTDITFLQDMGTDPEVLFGYINRVRIHTLHNQQYIQILTILFPNIVSLCTKAVFTTTEETT